MKAFVVAVPLFFDNMVVNSYRLCARNSERLYGTNKDFKEMNDYLISPDLDLLEEVGIDVFALDKKLFIDINPYQLMLGYPRNFVYPPERIVCVLPGGIERSETIVQKCGELLELGYSLALDGLAESPAYDPLISLVSYYIINYSNPNYGLELKKALPNLKNRFIVFTEIMDTATFEKLGNSSKSLYSGLFYSHPATESVNEIGPIKTNILRLMSQINQDDFDLVSIASTIEKDAALSISLLRFINSAAIGATQKIQSIRNAVAILGQKEAKHWAMVAISLNLSSDRPGEISRLSLIRAKFAENLANLYRLENKKSLLFLTGLFSMLDVILQTTIESAIKEISIESEVADALVTKTGPFHEVMELVYAYERADWDGVSTIMLRKNLNPADIIDAFVNALKWYKEIIE